MQILFLIFAVLLPVGCLCWFLSAPSSAELEQAALLPFADDPPAAERVRQQTGRCCEQLMTPVFEPLVNPYSARLDA